MASSALAVIEEARIWVGTPFRHQAAVKGAGCDCAGLIRGVGVALDLLPDFAQRWGSHANYSRLPNPRQMERALRAFLLPVEPAQMRLADVLWLQWREDLPMHLALLSEHQGRPTLIHALSDFGRVVEHGLTAEWRSRIASVWRYPGVEAPDGP